MSDQHNPWSNSNTYRATPSRPSSEICREQKSLADPEDLCKDDETPTPDDLDTIQAMLTLSHQYQQLMQESHPSDEQIRQIDAILELAQYDEALNTMLNQVDHFGLEQSSNPHSTQQPLTNRQVLGL